MKVGGNRPGGVQSFQHKQVVVVQQGQVQQGGAQPNLNGANQAQVNINGQLGVATQGMIPGAQGTRNAMLGAVNNPAALMQVAQAGAQMGAQLQAMSQFGMQAMNAMGLGGMPQTQQLAMMNHIGQQMSAQATGMAAGAMAQQVMGMMGPQAMQALGSAVMSMGMNRAGVENMGGQFLNGLAQQPNTHWGRQALGSLGPQFFNNFDPRSLAAMPNRALAPFSNSLMGGIRGNSPFQLGQQLLGQMTPGMNQNIGQNLLGMIPQPRFGDIGNMLQQGLAQSPMGAATGLLKNLGLGKLGDIGKQLFGGIKDFKNNIGNLGQGLGGKLMNMLTQGKDWKQNLLGGIKNFAQDKLFGPLTNKLTGFGTKLLGKLGGGLLGKAGAKALDFLKGGGIGKLGGKLIDKFGGKLLGKLGGAGKILGGALSLLNGKFDTKKALQMAMNFIPGVGPILGALSSIPGVGKIFDKVLGGAAKLLEKIPGVGALVKGVGKVFGGVGKVAGKVLGGVKKIGKKILGGVKKLVKGW